MPSRAVKTFEARTAPALMMGNLDLAQKTLRLSETVPRPPSNALLLPAVGWVSAIGTQGT